MASASAWDALNERWKLLSDIGTERARARDKNRNAYPGFVLAGLMYLPTPNLDVDVGMRMNLRCRACSALSNDQVGVGLAARF